METNGSVSIINKKRLQTPIEIDMKFYNTFSNQLSVVTDTSSSPVNILSGGSGLRKGLLYVVDPDMLY